MDVNRVDWRGLRRERESTGPVRLTSKCNQGKAGGGVLRKESRAWREGSLLGLGSGMSGWLGTGTESDPKELGAVEAALGSRG